MCEYPGKPRHGDMEGEFPAQFGSVVSYLCSDGFALIGESEIVCGGEGQWTGSKPECKREYEGMWWCVRERVRERVRECVHERVREHARECVHERVREHVRERDVSVYVSMHVSVCMSVYVSMYVSVT